MAGMALAEMQPHVELPFLINDADNHFVEPRDLYVNYVDPKWRHKAVTFEADEEGRWVGVFGGAPVPPQPGGGACGGRRRCRC